MVGVSWSAPGRCRPLPRTPGWLPLRLPTTRRAAWQRRAACVPGGGEQPWRARAQTEALVSWGGRLTTFLSLLVLVLGGLAAVDALTALPSATTQAARADPRGRHSDAGLRPGRAFV